MVFFSFTKLQTLDNRKISQQVSIAWRVGAQHLKSAT